MFGSKVHHVVGREEFDGKLLALDPQTVVVIDWFAPWCGPCRAVAPKFEQLAQQYSNCLFLSVDTENPGNSTLAPVPRLTAFPTFEVFVYPRNKGNYDERFEGANMTKLEASIVEAMQQTDKIPIKFVQRNKSDIHVRSKPESTLQQLAKQQQRTNNEVWVFNKRVLDFHNRLGWTLEELGFDEKSENVVRVLPLATKLRVRIKVVGGVDDSQDEHLATFGPFATCAALLREAQRVTKTMAPKVIYLGKMVEDSDKLLSSVVQDQATVLCMPMGPPYVPTQEKAPIKQQVIKKTISQYATSLYIDEDEDIYALEEVIPVRKEEEEEDIYGAVEEKAAATTPAPMEEEKAAATTLTPMEEEKVEEPAPPTKAPRIQIKFLSTAELSPVLIKAEKLYTALSSSSNASKPGSVEEGVLMKSYRV